MPHPNERTDAIKNAQALLEQKPVYLDTETTGLERSDEIIEIALIDFDGTLLLDTLVRPQIRIPFGATRVHHITDGMLTQAPSWPEVWPQIHTLLSGRLTAIYNEEFDIKLMKQTTEKNRIPWSAPYLATTCIMQLYARYFGEWNEYRGSFAWQSLEKAARQCRIELPNTHRARQDALLARAILEHMAGEEYAQETLF
jgi:DNA polymerase-3 subunit epsilon